ncbi:UspA domain-containing protein [Oscillatoria nigro-viridis PCC 7112]|uniref:UspA domain-containing protein n=1 Tax=Phormidium nigroviride PCC 7112 TaxID=179408 RepID=K9VHE6_9CYAN|nr:universal stress protein [Oscillatoria nigro-viridis]AFZ07381.1 UspA domain-containing protein [Oscillatoria nigro-viridis PCC 7112]
MSFKKIFAALDDSELGHRVFTQALELALSDRAEVMLFNCVTVNSLGETAVPIPVDLGMNVELMDQAYQAQRLRLEREVKHASGLLKNYCDAAANKGLQVEFDCKMEGDPGHCICESAENWGADLIVLGRRGRTGFTEAFLGSVSNYVVHHASCSVLVIQEVKIEK